VFCYVVPGMKRLLLLCLAVLVWTPVATAKQSDTAQQSDTAKQSDTAQQSHTAQQAQAAPRSSDQRLTDAESEIQALWQSYFVVVRDDLPNTKGSLDCGGARYEEIKATNSFLVFFVSCERIEPYLDGYQATIAVGNPHTFGFNRVSGTLSYGENIAAALVNESQRIPFSLTSELRPGTWTRIHVPIARTQARDIGKIVVQVEVSGIAGFGGTAAPSRTTDAPQHGLLGRRQETVSPGAPR
jgi:hypothetical protein